MVLHVGRVCTVVALAAAAAVPGGAAESAATAKAPPTPLHYIVNDVTSAIATVSALGYNVIDTSSLSKSVIDRYGARGVRSLVYIGWNKDVCAWDVPDREFSSAVHALAGDRNVVGYYLADEPHPYVEGPRGHGCSGVAGQIARRADLIHSVSTVRQKALIAVSDGSVSCPASRGLAPGCEFAALQPARTHVDWVALDPYPCSTGNGGCAYGEIGQRVSSAVKNGIGKRHIVPVFQVFGEGRGGYYTMPTPRQLRQLLATWDALAPAGGWPMDYTYTWGSEVRDLQNSPVDRPVMKAHNDGSGP